MPSDPGRQPFQHEPQLFGTISEAYFRKALRTGGVGLPEYDWPELGEDPYGGGAYEDGVPIDRFSTPSNN
jgi:hypothetical protein